MGVQGVVIDDARRVLLVRHTYRPGWHFPGGGVECGETVETALSRELGEEAGVIIDAPPKLFGIYNNARYFPSDHVVLFIVPAWRQPVAPKPNVEIAEHGFFSLDALPERTHVTVKRRINEMFNDEQQDALW